MFDLLIRDGTVIDGTGKEPYCASIGIKDGTIQAIGDLQDAQSAETINAQGLHVTPGFINTHSHSDIVLLFDNKGENMLSQGITTEVAGHCGESVIPLSDIMLSDFKTWLPEELFREIQNLRRDPRSIMEHISKSGPGTNIALMVGHGTIRSKVMGYDDRIPTIQDMDKMKALLQEAMEAGAFGMTSGLIYPPGVYAQEDELIQMCIIVAAYGGIYASHMRNESDRVVDSVAETIRVAEIAGLPALISHHKIAGKHNWGKSKDTLTLIDQANQKGLKIRCDQYPYHAGATSLISALPPAFASDGQLEYVNKLKDGQIRHTIKQLLRRSDAGFENLISYSGYDGVLVLYAPLTTWAQGKTILEIAIAQGEEPEDVIFDLIIANNGNIQAAFFSMGEEDIQRIMQSQYAMGATDAYFTNAYLSCDHPRFKGAFIKILSEYVRDKKVLPLPEAIRKLTSLPANMVGLKSKGVLAEGYDADIVVFDYASLRATSDFVNPLAPNEGVRFVLVNGKIAVKDDEATGVRAGKLLYKR
jgi:N-acyl-D-amino-acid deacylase